MAAEPPTLDCRELRWWYIVPALGDQVSFGVYEAPDWRLKATTTLRTVADAKVHDVAGVRIDVAERTRDGAPTDGISAMYGRLADDAAEWLAIVDRHNGRETLSTFLNERFRLNWGSLELDRRLGGAGDSTLKRLGTNGTRASTRLVIDGANYVHWYDHVVARPD